MRLDAAIWCRLVIEKSLHSLVRKELLVSVTHWLGMLLGHQAMLTQDCSRSVRGVRQGSMHILCKAVSVQVSDHLSTAGDHLCLTSRWDALTLLGLLPWSITAFKSLWLSSGAQDQGRGLTAVPLQS